MSDKKKIRVSDEDFISAVVKVLKINGSHADVAKETGLKINSVATRLSVLRKEGVDIPKFQTRRNKKVRDVAGLNATIAKALETK